MLMAVEDPGLTKMSIESKCICITTVGNFKSKHMHKVYGDYSTILE